MDGKPLAIDVAVHCPLSSKSDYKITNPADEYAIRYKYDKYSDAFEGSGINFMAVVVDVFGGYGADALAIISSIARRAADRSMLERSVFISQCWQRLSVSLQLANARMIATRVGLVKPFVSPRVR